MSVRQVRQITGWILKYDSCIDLFGLRPSTASNNSGSAK